MELDRHDDDGDDDDVGDLRLLRLVMGWDYDLLLIVTKNVGNLHIGYVHCKISILQKAGKRGHTIMLIPVE